MKKILYIATTADRRDRLDGETIKCRLLREYLENIDDIKVFCVDTDNWKKHVLKLVFEIIYYFIMCDEIIVSSADRGANIVLDFFYKIKLKKKIYYFVIGGSLCKNIISKKWKKEVYDRLEIIYVEADSLKQDLEKLGLKNVVQLNNFRKVEDFENKYQKDDYIKFVYYGRVIKEKGIEHAIELIKKLNQNGYKSKLHIYGQCEEEYLNQLQSDFDENIEYFGKINPDNKTEYEILSQYDIFVFPTEYPGECLPGALIDSYISGLAVVVSNWKYAKEYVEDNKNGIIFEYQNYDDMYVKTKKMLDDNVIDNYKNRSLELSKKYMLDNILVDFKKMIME